MSERRWPAHHPMWVSWAVAGRARRWSGWRRVPTAERPRRCPAGSPSPWCRRLAWPTATRCRRAPPRSRRRSTARGRSRHAGASARRRGHVPADTAARAATRRTARTWVARRRRPRPRPKRRRRHRRRRTPRPDTSSGPRRVDPPRSARTVSLTAVDDVRSSFARRGAEREGVTMHVGMSSIFQGFGGTLSDREVWEADLRLADLAEPLGFESIWSVEHHFSDYTMCPDVLQFLTYMAGRTTTVKLGSMVLVLPWHDPVRAAEQIILLDHMSNGRLILGLGRGTGQDRVRRLPRGDVPGPPAVQGVGRGDPRRAGDRRDGVPRRVHRPAAHRAAPAAATPRSRAARTRRRSRRSRRRSWPGSAPAC